MRTTRIAPIITLAGFLVAAGTLRAQAVNPPMVPLELVQTLAFTPFADAASPDVLVGRLPDDIADVVAVPADGRIIGSLVFRHNAVSAVAVPGPEQAMLDSTKARLMAAGWTKYDPPQQRGFASNRYMRTTYCLGDTLSLNMRGGRDPDGGRSVLFVSASSRTASICRTQQPATSRRTAGPSLIPSLTPPEGSMASGSGAGSGSGEEYARARVRTDLSAAQLIEHYDAQLQAAGWTLIQRLTADDAAVATYRVTDPEGAAWQGVLTAATPSAESATSPRFLSLRVLRLERSY